MRGVHSTNQTDMAGSGTLRGFLRGAAQVGSPNTPWNKQTRAEQIPLGTSLTRPGCASSPLARCPKACHGLRGLVAKARAPSPPPPSPLSHSPLPSVPHSALPHSPLALTCRRIPARRPLSVFCSENRGPRRRTLSAQVRRLGGDWPAGGGSGPPKLLANTWGQPGPREPQADAT